MNKIKTFIAKHEDKIMTTATALTTAAAYMSANSVAFAGGASASDIGNLIAKILGGGATIMGAIRLVTGIISYASAQDDANGAEMKKAEGKITAGIILAAVGIVVYAMGPTIAGWMTI